MWPDNVLAVVYHFLAAIPALNVFLMFEELSTFFYLFTCSLNWEWKREQGAYGT